MRRKSILRRAKDMSLQFKLFSDMYGKIALTEFLRWDILKLKTGGMRVCAAAGENRISGQKIIYER